MSRASNGTYTAPTNSWNPAIEGTAIDETDWNAILDDIETALTDSLSVSGKGKVTAHIDFDENGSPGTPASNVGRFYAADVGGLTTPFWKDAAGNTYNLLLSSPGLSFTFDTSTTTSADPGAGKVRFNNATVSSVTEIAVDDADAVGNDVATFLNNVAANTYLIFTKRTGAGVAIFQATGVTNDSGFTKYAVTYTDHDGTFAAADPLSLSVGPAGPAGAAGASGLNWRGAWLTATAFSVNDGTSNGGSSYICTVAHTSGASTEPGVGASWATVWDVIAEKGAAGAGTGDLIAANNLSDVGSAATAFGNIKQAASETATGVVELATEAEATTGSDTSRAVTPAGLKAHVDARNGVSAAATIADNRVVRGDGGSRGAQESAVAIDDSGNMSGVGTLITSGVATVGTTAATAVKMDPSGFVELPEISAPSTPASGFLRLYAKSDGKAYQKDDAGTETDLSASGGGGSGGASLEPENLGIAVSASGSALTVALKGADGNDPSGSNIVYLPFRSATGTTGTITTRQVTSATSLTISSGSTMGVSSTTAFRLWLLAFDDGGTVRLGLVNCLSQASSVATSILGLTDNGIASSTAEGGSGAADSAQVIYTGTAVTSKPYRILGYLEWNTSGVTAGTWTTTNLALVQPYHVGIPTPGQPTGRRATTNKTDTFTSSTATTWTDITGYSASITPTSAANAVRWQFTAYISVGNTNGAGLRMVRGSTAIGVGDVDGSRTQVTGLLNRSADTNSASVISNQSIDLPQSASSTTYKVQFFLQSDTFYFNRATTTTDSNVVLRAMSNVQLEEIMT